MKNFLKMKKSKMMRLITMDEELPEDEEFDVEESDEEEAAEDEADDHAEALDDTEDNE